MEFYEVIQQRRSIRKYLSPPSEEQLDRIIGAAALAPSPFNRQGWDIVVIKDPEICMKLGEIKKRLTLSLHPESVSGKLAEVAQAQEDAFRNVYALMVYHRAKGAIQGREYRYDAGGGWLFLSHICLAAVAEGLGTRIFSYWDEAEKEVDILLKVPEEKRQVSGVTVGVPDPAEEIRKRILKPKEKWMHLKTF